MSSPSPSQLPASVNHRNISRQLEAFRQTDTTRQQLVESLWKRVLELENALETSKSDLEDQTNLRREWKSKAESAEAQMARGHFALVLIDGDRHTFNHEYLQNDATGGADAALALSSQVRSYLEGRRIITGAPELVIMIHVFANKAAVSQALVDSGTISEPAEFDHFITQLMQTSPFIYFIDCGPSSGAVDNKIKESYEFHFENSHCKHLALALGHETGYITELDAYREDESTLAKTTLIRPSNAGIGKYASTFRTVDIPALWTIPLISLEGDTVEHLEQTETKVTTGIRPRRNKRNHDLQDLFDGGARTVKESSSVESGKGISPNPSTSVHDSSSTSASIMAEVQHDDSEKLARDSMPSPPKQQIQVASPASRANAAPIKQSNHAAYPAMTHSYMNDWENAPATDIYTPGPDLRPWGADDDVPWDAPSSMMDTRQAGRSMADDHVAQSTHTAVSPSRREAGQIPPGYARRTGANLDLTLRNRPTSAQASSWRRHPVDDDVPEFVTGANREMPASLMQSKYSAPPGEVSRPSSPQRATEIGVNKYGERIDLPLPHASIEDQRNFDMRCKIQKLCNEHQLRGACRSKVCPHDHGPIDEAELRVLRLKARTLPCSIGPECRRSDCFYGHHCPYGKKSGCSNKRCSFRVRGMHDVDDHEVARYILP